MSIQCWLWQIVDETVEDIKNEPSSASLIIDEMAEYNEELPQGQKILLSLDKAWDGLNYLLIKHSPQEFGDFIVRGGESLSGTDRGYGEARWFNPAQTRAIAKIFDGLTFDKLKNGVTVAELVEGKVYPFREDESESDVFGYLRNHFEPIRSFLAAAVGMKTGLLVDMC